MESGTIHEETYCENAMGGHWFIEVKQSGIVEVGVPRGRFDAQPLGGINSSSGSNGDYDSSFDQSNGDVDMIEYENEAI